ncbi:MAG: DCC1-like thiol-disulfide oxidoreductase family protein [Solirubrobacteraceae bacterium]
MAPDDDHGPRWRVLYDADCGFCRCSLALLLALDRARHLLPVALGTPLAARLLRDLDEQQRAASWHLVDPEGARSSAGAALADLLALLPGGRLPAALLRRFPAATERGYRWVADHRGPLGRALPESAKRRATARIARRS